MSNLTCPACGHIFKSRKAVPRHVNTCKQWDSVVRTPPSTYNFDAHFHTGFYVEEMMEGQDYVACFLCREVGEDSRFGKVGEHLRVVHGSSLSEYLSRYPGTPTRSEASVERRKASVKAAYGVDFIGQSDHAKEKTRQTSLERYGVEHSALAPEVLARRLATNVERFGAENPFASPEIQERIRQKHIATRGVENPGQDPSVMAKRVETNRERYGADHFVETDDFKEKFRAASQERFGTDHPMQSEEGQQLHAEGMRAVYGVTNPFFEPSIKQRAYETNLAKHGGKHSQQCPEVLAKARATWMEKYGEDNPSRVEAVKARIKEVWMGKYGVPFPPQSLWTSRDQSFPNNVEKAVDALSPECVVYAGDGSYWVRHKGSSRARNPDFVVLDREQVRAYQGGAKLNGLRTSAVIEVFGDYWHGPAKTGKQRETHKHEVEKFYGLAGLACLVLWESEIKTHPQRCGERVQRFLRDWRRGVYLDVKAESATADVLDLFG